MIIIIDATNIGGGGGVTHLKEILNNYCLSNPITVIAQKKILDQLPEYDFLTKVEHKLLEKTIIHRLFFQIFIIDKFIPKNSVLFSITGDFLGKHKPVVSMSQNMLLYERDIWKEIKQPKEIIRFWLNFLKQKRSFRNSKGIIFISDYAKNYITKQLDLREKKIAIIHHGISPRFLKDIKTQKHISDYSFSRPFKFIYVSTIHTYKNQWNVVEAIGQLREQGYPVELDLVGGVIFEPAGKKLEVTIQRIDPKNIFIHNHGHIAYEEIDKFYNIADGIIFASTCENMPNILIESMASGIPIVSSKKQPMPEFLKGNGFYFDAHNIDSMVDVLIEFLDSPQKREINAINAFNEALKYSWEETSNKTFEYLISIYQNN